MAYEHILVEREDGVGILTLNRPDKLNAMNRQLVGELRDAVKEMDADDGDRLHRHHRRRRARLFRRRRHPRAARGRPPLYAGRARRAPRPRQLRDRRQREADDRHDERPRLWRRGGAGVVARHADRLREHPVPLSRRRLWPDQQHLDPAQPGRLADRQGTAVFGAHRRGRGGLPHRPAEPPGAARAAARQDDGAGAARSPATTAPR